MSSSAATLDLNVSLQETPSLDQPSSPKQLADTLDKLDLEAHQQQSAHSLPIEDILERNPLQESDTDHQKHCTVVGQAVSPTQLGNPSQVQTLTEQPPQMTSNLILEPEHVSPTAPFDDIRTAAIPSEASQDQTEIKQLTESQATTESDSKPAEEFDTVDVTASSSDALGATESDAKPQTSADSSFKDHDSPAVPSLTATISTPTDTKANSADSPPSVVPESTEAQTSSIVSEATPSSPSLASNGGGQSDTPSRPQSNSTFPSAEREALADPVSVAAIAQAFGRSSSSVSSSINNSRPSSRAGNTPLSQNQLPSFPPQAQQEDVEETCTTIPSAVVVVVDHSDATSKSSGSGSGLLSSPDPSQGSSSKQAMQRNSSSSVGSGIKMGKGPPPTTQASEELPFDFNRFLEQMKHRSAQPVGDYVRSFIKGFAKKPYRTQDQIKLVFDFLDFISARMRECQVWAHLSDTDLDNAKEAMEKLVMNRLYPYTFTPAVQREARWNVQTDDLERDRVLKQRIALFSWIKEEHLDVPVRDHSRGFIEFSIQELLKINHYKAPRDKLICILNCCKVIFGLIRHLSTEENADTFIPVLIFVVLKANPDNLISNVEYISRFRNPDRLSSESGYYLSSLMGAVAFIETMDYTSLSNITQEEFEKNVEVAVSSLPEPESSIVRSSAVPPPAISTPPRSNTPSLLTPGHRRSTSATSVTSPSAPGEESAKALASSLADDTRAFFQRTGEAARAGFGKPMGALGRLINEGIEGIRTPIGGPSESGTNSPSAGGQAMSPSNSRSRLFAGLFGSNDPDPAASPQPKVTAAASASASGSKAIGVQIPAATKGSNTKTFLGVDEEPQTPSTGEMGQDGFLPFNAGQAGVAPNAPARLRPKMAVRGYSIDDYDDDETGRRDLLGGTGTLDRHTEHDEHDGYDDTLDDDDDDGGDKATPNSAAIERMRRRRQMQQDFGGGYMPTFLNEAAVQATPSRRDGRSSADQAVLQRGPIVDGRPSSRLLEEQETRHAIEQSLFEQNAQAEEEAQYSAGVETLRSIFPSMEVGVIQIVLQGCDGNVEMAIDRLLEMQ